MVQASILNTHTRQKDIRYIVAHEDEQQLAVIIRELLDEIKFKAFDKIVFEEITKPTTIYTIECYHVVFIVNHWGFFYDKETAEKKLKQLQEEYPENNYRIKEYYIEDWMK